MTRFDNFIQHNEGQDINLVLSSYGGDVYSMLGTIDYFKTLPVKVDKPKYFNIGNGLPSATKGTKAR